MIPPRNGAVFGFFQGKSGTLYLMHPQTQRREVHQIILQKMPEEDVNAGFIYHH